MNFCPRKVLHLFILPDCVSIVALIFGLIPKDVVGDSPHMSIGILWVTLMGRYIFIWIYLDIFSSVKIGRLQHLITSVYYLKLILCNFYLVYLPNCHENTLIRILKYIFLINSQKQTLQGRLWLITNTVSNEIGYFKVESKNSHRFSPL